MGINQEGRVVDQMKSDEIVNMINLIHLRRYE